METQMLFLYNFSWERYKKIFIWVGILLLSDTYHLQETTPKSSISFQRNIAFICEKATFTE